MVRGLALVVALAGAAFAAQPQALVAPPGPDPAVAAAPHASVPPRIAAADFARNPDLTDPQLSPRGTQLLAITVVDGRERLFVHDLASGLVRPVTLPLDQDIEWFDWAGEHRVLVSLSHPVRSKHAETVVTRLRVVDLESGASRELGDIRSGDEGDDVLYADPAGDWLLVSMQRTTAEYPSVVRFDLRTGAAEVVVAPHPNVWEWYADDSGTVRVGLGYRTKTWFELYRPDGASPFRNLGKRSYDDEASGIDLLQLAHGSDEGFVLSDARTGRYALYRFDFARQKLGELVYESPANDIDDYSVSRDGRRVLAVFFADERDRVRWLDPVMQQRQQSLERQFADRQVMFQSRDDTYSRFLVWIGGANDPGAYYYYEPGTDTVRRVARVNDRLDPAWLAPTRYVNYRARDGLEIPAYLTLPVGREPHDLPLVVVPHGGPYYVRDTLGYDPEVQFLANRGYAVLQPNFRGSSGYGEAFYEKGQGQWGRAMQDDLDDGVDWLVHSGTVDPARVCIEGSSYGGYAALWAVTRNPERYRCAASFAGVTDVRRQLKYQSSKLDARERADWRDTVEGAHGFDLDSVSPLHQVARLERPVLVAHGNADSTVLFQQAELYRAALAHAGKQFEFVAYPGEGHGLYDPANFTDWLDRLDRFLAKYNPADRAAAGDYRAEPTRGLHH